MEEKHFKGKEAVEHVAEMQAKGIVDRHENHSLEITGRLSSFIDTLKETAILLSILSLLPSPFTPTAFILLVIGFGYLLWRTFRSCWLGWTRLERLHNLIKQEKWEIDHHRPQEKRELKALYRAKGFEGKLLDDVVDVLMADSDRLLKVMVEEELGLTLEAQEHPLQQGLGAFIGGFAALAFVSLGFALFSTPAALAATYALVTASCLFGALYEDRKWVSEIIWNIGAVVAAHAFVYYLFDYIRYA